ncbi:MAG: hypothetical protein LAN37_03110 [Acidobacteriia bacterium]|nr:hypothetical protein [Terriglobia bacterium]
MPEDDLRKAVAQLRTDVITALTKLEVEVTALQYAVLDKEPMTAQRLEALQFAAKHDVKMFRDYFEKHIRPV